MKPRVTSQEKILEQAMEIAKKEGVDKLSVRKLSSACGIAIGSVYNYFPNMDTLMTAMADAFWTGIFKDQTKVYRSGMGFTFFLEQYYIFFDRALA